MTLHAYLNDPEIRTAMMDTLDENLAEQRIYDTLSLWDGKKGTVSGAILQSNIREQWAEKTGLAIWISYVIDTISGPMNKNFVSEEIRSLLKAIPVGVDTTPTGSAIISGFFSQLLDDSPQNQQLETAIKMIKSLHDRCHQGEIITTTEWKKARKDAIKTSDSLPPLPENRAQASPDVLAQHAIGSMIESACWDPMLSPTAVSEVVRNWLYLQSLSTHQAYGWTDEDIEKTECLLTEMSDRFIITSQNEGKDVFELLAIHYPEFESRLSGLSLFHKKYRTECARKACQFITHLLSRQLLLPRKTLFGNPTRSHAAISPDGQRLSWSEIGPNGVMNLQIAPIDHPENQTQITFDTKHGVQGHFWAFDSDHILYSQDNDGDENYQIYSVNIHTQEKRSLTPFKESNSFIVSLSQEHKNKILISNNQRNKYHSDLYLLDLDSGKLSLALENKGVDGYIVDEDFTVRFTICTNQDGGQDIYELKGDGEEELFLSFSAEDARTSGVSHLDRSGQYLYVFDSRGRDIAALTEINLITRQVKILAESQLADIAGIINDRKTLKPVAYYINHERAVLTQLDNSLKHDIEFLKSQNIEHWAIVSRSDDDAIWLLRVSSDTDPGSVYIYQRNPASLALFFSLRPELAGVPLARMQPFTIDSRDGLPLVCYISIPRDYDTGNFVESVKPLPLVLNVHGGPWARDSFGFSTSHQWLCNRGYAVLNVNFRSSTGFGKKFLTAGDGEWGNKMNHDLEDAINWLIDRKVADIHRIAIMGTSYGGYAVLSGLTSKPGFYACGIDVVGPANLQTLLEAIPPQWESARKMLYQAVGNPETEEGKKALYQRSPVHFASRIKDPLLIAQGANDPRVPRREPESMVEQLKKYHIPVSYILFPDEGHGFSREPNRLIFNALTENFLAKYLGGNAEPYSGDDYPGNTMQIVEDAGE